MKTMSIYGVTYIEKDASLLPMFGVNSGLCGHCALFRNGGCEIAILGAAEQAFGGDCSRNDVVYVRVTSNEANT